MGVSARDVRPRTSGRMSMSDNCRTLRRRLVWLACLGIVAVGAQLAFADGTGVVTKIVSDDQNDPRKDCDTLLGRDVDVCDVYVRFGQSTDKLHVVGFSGITTSAPGGFVQVSAAQGGADTAPSDSAIQSSPKLICDSFVTVGLRSVPTGSTDCSAVAPDFDRSFFNGGGRVVGSWYCNNPLNPQGNPGPTNDVLVAQLTVPAGSRISGEVTIFYNTGTTAPVVKSFSCTGLGPDEVFLLGKCMTGPETPLLPGCEAVDLNGDHHIDLEDFAELQNRFRNN